MFKRRNRLNEKTAGSDLRTVDKLITFWLKKNDIDFTPDNYGYWIWAGCRKEKCYLWTENFAPGEEYSVFLEIQSPQSSIVSYRREYDLRVPGSLNRLKEDIFSFTIAFTNEIMSIVEEFRVNAEKLSDLELINTVQDLFDCVELGDNPTGLPEIDCEVSDWLEEEFKNIFATELKWREENRLV